VGNRRLVAAFVVAVGIAGGAEGRQRTWLDNLADRMRDVATAQAADLGGPVDNAAEPHVPQPGAVRLNESGLIDVHFRNTPIPLILEMMSYEFQVSIVATGAVTDSVSANLYSVTIDEALEAILRPKGYVFHHNGKVIYVGTAEDIATLLPPPETRVFWLRYMDRAAARDAVQSVLSTAGSVIGEARGGGAGGLAQSGGVGAAVEENAGVNYLIVTDYADRLDHVGRLLKELDVRPLQVLVEATILRATLNEDNQFGIDFTLLGGVDFENVGSTSNSASNLATGALPANEFQHTAFNVNTEFASQLPGGFSFGVIKDSVAVFVRALEDVTDVTVVANPKLVALNRQNAQVIVGRRDGYLTTTVTETAAVQTVEFLETGTQIEFRPIINNDGTVRLEVHPKDSNGGLTADNLPFEETTEAHAQIVVRDGHTVMIGGLFRERTVSSESQLPVLGDLPLAGVLFKSTLDQTIREEVVILLTVHILSDTEGESQWAEGVLEDVERIRVGSRKGLMESGRERLAQAFYQEALSMFERGEHDRALLNVRMSLHNNPTHLAALKLKEQLMGERMWDSDGTRSRTLAQELLRDHGVGQPDFGRRPAEWDLLEADTPKSEDRPASQPSRDRAIEPKDPVTIEDAP
jgi:type IV pilus assembly protein PilQ